MIFCRTPAQFARQQQRDPATHRRTDENLGAAAIVVEHREAVFQPSADRSIGKVTAQFTMPGVVETHEIHGLCALPSRQVPAP